MSKSAVRRTADLPKSEMNTFTQLVQLSDSRQYKKAIKVAETILAKHPEHADSVAIKALCLHRMETVGGKAVALNLAKQAIKLDMRSRLAWHVVGIIYRQDGDYAEAVKNLKMAVRMEEDNAPLWRELAGCLTQEESWDALLESRIKLLELNRTQEGNFHGVATAHFMAGQFNEAGKLAEHTLKQFYLKNYVAPAEGAREEVEDWKTVTGRMDTILFIATCKERLGLYKEALDFLLDHEKYCPYNVSLLERAAALASYSGDYPQAAELYKRLLQRFQENQNALFGYLLNTLAAKQDNLALQTELAAAGLLPPAAPLAPASEQRPSVLLVSPPEHPAGSLLKGWLNETLTARFPSFVTPLEAVSETSRGWKSVAPLFDGGKAWALRLFNSKLSSVGRAAIEETLASLKTEDKFAKCGAATRTQFLFQTSETLTATLEPFIALHLRKGVPASGMLALLQGIADATNSLKEVHAILKSIVERLQRAGRSLNAEEPVGTPDETADVEVGALSLLACWEDLLGNQTEALRLLDAALVIAPTSIDLYTLKGRVLKHAGAYRLAAQHHEEARSLDLADKHLNVRATRYWLRVNETQIGDDTLHMFPGEVGKKPNLHDTQVMWYERKMGNALLRVGQADGTRLGEGLRHLAHSVAHFHDYTCCAYDFHPYVLRNGDIAQYTRFLAAVGRNKAHVSYTEAAVPLMEAYLGLHTGAIPLDHAAVEARKAAAEAELKEKEKKENKGKVVKKIVNPEDNEAPLPKRVEEDPEGFELLLAPSHLELAVKIAEDVRVKCKLDAHANLTAAKVWAAAKKPLLALQALARALHILQSPSHPLLLPVVAKVFAQLDLSTLPAGVQAAALETAQTLVPTSVSVKDVASLKAAAASLATNAYSLMSASPVTAQATLLKGAVEAAAGELKTLPDDLKAALGQLSPAHVIDLVQLVKTIKTFFPAEVAVVAQQTLAQFPLCDEARTALGQQVEALTLPEVATA